MRIATQLIGVYLLGILTSGAPQCCDYDSSVGWNDFTLESAEAANAPDSESGGSVVLPQPPLSTVSFIFYEGTKDVAAVQVLAWIVGSKEEPVLEYRDYKMKDAFVVELDCLKGKTVHFAFKFINEDGLEVGKYRAQAHLDQSLITYHDQRMGDSEIVVNHTQPPEVELVNGTKNTIALGRKSQLWYGGKIHEVRNLIVAPPDAEILAPECSLERFTPTSFGIEPDKSLGDIVDLELSPL
ncbi:hypothetical protein JW758_06115 [Candidatus Peregrinibacteria bacterium]|nr:hypothetical protein [Candidatus Peregrinibacteria bacterium]